MCALCCRGFCKHRGPDFGPWHRAYMKMFEDALIKACYTVAGEAQLLVSGPLCAAFGVLHRNLTLPRQPCMY